MIHVIQYKNYHLINCNVNELYFFEKFEQIN